MSRTLLIAALLSFSIGWLLTSVNPTSAESPEAHADGVRVVELFTSMSCSSCPPADAVLAELDRADDTIAVAYHVTYWNHLNWKDRLSRPFADERQTAYAAKASGGRVYTPQLVVGARKELVGSRRSAVRASVSDSPRVPRLQLSRTGSQLDIRAPAGAVPADASVVVLGVDRHTKERILRGENAGNHLAYTNSVLTLEAVGRGGESGHWTARVPTESEVDRIVVLAQNPKTFEYYAAGQLDI